MRTILHVSPHADDELIGCPATLLALQNAGDRVVDLLLNLSSAEQIARRTREAVEAHRRSGLELRLLDTPAVPPEGIYGDLGGVEDRVTERLVEQLADLQPDVVVGPQVHDVHEAHELSARAIRRAIETHGAPRRWLMWGIWADLALPTLLTPFDEQRLHEIVHALEAYAGEVDRNDYRALTRGRGLTGAVAGSERVFGFGSPKASPLPYAELLTDARFDGHRWRLGGPGLFDGSLPEPPAVVDATEWLDQTTLAKPLLAQWRRS